MTKVNQIVPFRMYQMPCCGHSLCWVNPRKPSYCPECGKFIIMEMKQAVPVIEEACILRSVPPTARVNR